MSDADRHRAASGAGPAIGAAGPEQSVLGVRIGQGFDVHPFTDDGQRTLVLGGVNFSGERGLTGHSDADVPAHAAADALLGAAGLGDLGQHFPDTDPQWKNANSIEMLEGVAILVRETGFTIGNIDIKVVCERPKLAPHRTEMEANLSRAVGAPVTVAGRRAEGLGAIGRGEGIAAYAVAVIGCAAPQNPPGGEASGR